MSTEVFGFGASTVCLRFIDVGNKDAWIASATQKLADVLTSYGIAHQFEIYEGNHIDHIADRMELKVVPFFSQNLSFDQHHR